MRVDAVKSFDAPKIAIYSQTWNNPKPRHSEFSSPVVLVPSVRLLMLKVIRGELSVINSLKYKTISEQGL